MKQSDLSAPAKSRFHLIHMEQIALSLTLAGIVACSLTGFAQTAAPAAEAPGAATTSSAAQPGTVIPLIVMDDVPLIDAVRNLARQAGINYMLDPKIGFGQAGPDGKTTAANYPV